MKEFLSREGHTVVVKNVDDDVAAYQEIVALGMRTVPVTLIGDRIIKGFDQDQLRSALDSVAGGERSDR